MTLFTASSTTGSSRLVEPEDLRPDLVDIQLSVRFAHACILHPDGGRHAVGRPRVPRQRRALRLRALRPGRAVPDATAEIAALRFLWSDGRAEFFAPAETPTSTRSWPACGPDRRIPPPRP